MIPAFDRKAHLNGARTACLLRVARYLVAISILVPAETVAQRISDPAQCVRCRVEAQVVARLGDADGPGALSGAPRAVTVDRAGRFWLSEGSGPPLIFDQRGKYLRQVGTAGRGPNEFLSPVEMIGLPGDSLMIVDQENGRVSIVAPNLQVARTLTLPPGSDFWSAIVVRWPDHVVLNGLIRTTQLIGWPMHAASLSGREVVIKQSFGSNQGELRAGGFADLRQRMWPGQNSFWAGDYQQYDVRRWDKDGKVLELIERRPSWFATKSPFGGGNRNTAPPPKVAAVFEDASQRLWVFTLVAAPAWREAWDILPPRPAGVVGEVSARRLPSSDRLYRTAVDVIDLKTKTLWAHTVLDAYIMYVLPDGRAVSYATTADEIPTVSILKLTIVGPGVGLPQQ